MLHATYNSSFCSLQHMASPTIGLHRWQGSTLKQTQELSHRLTISDQNVAGSVRDPDYGLEGGIRGSMAACCSVMLQPMQNCQNLVFAANLVQFFLHAFILQGHKLSYKGEMSFAPAIPLFQRAVDDLHPVASERHWQWGFLHKSILTFGSAEKQSTAASRADKAFSALSEVASGSWFCQYLQTYAIAQYRPHGLLSHKLNSIVKATNLHVALRCRYAGYRGRKPIQQQQGCNASNDIEASCCSWLSLSLAARKNGYMYLRRGLNAIT